ncbi:hypothetical protein J6590_001930 [Homalodisca vitripennis]|nr:hypothetical protein J6590_001930 [Homalodisca vitripennis]
MVRLTATADKQANSALTDEVVGARCQPSTRDTARRRGEDAMEWAGLDTTHAPDTAHGYITWELGQAGYRHNTSSICSEINN